MLALGVFSVLEEERSNQKGQIFFLHQMHIANNSKNLTITII